MDTDCSNFPQNRDNMRDFVSMVINIQTNKQNQTTNHWTSQPISQPNQENYQTNPPNEPTDQPTQWSRVLLKKLTALQLRKKFPVFYGTSAPPIIPIASQSNPGKLSHPTSLSSHLLPGIPSDLFPSSFRTKDLCAFPHSPYMPHIPPIWLPLFDHPINAR